MATIQTTRQHALRAAGEWSMRRVPENRYQSGAGFYITARIRHVIGAADRGRFAQLVIDTLLFYRRRGDILLGAFVVMPDHVHFVIRLREPLTLSRWLNRFKSYVATHFGAGPIWQAGCWSEMIVSSPFFWQKVRYIHNNPVKAGLVEKPEDWIWSSAVDYASAETSNRIDF
jgi:putative transposase